MAGAPSNQAQQAAHARDAAGAASFEHVLEKNLIEKNLINKKLAGKTALQFSKHASARLSSRSIYLTSEQLTRIEDGVRAARAKGISDSLVLVDNVALVVNIGSRTVITAMTGHNNENVFTNIDGAVIV